LSESGIAIALQNRVSSTKNVTERQYKIRNLDAVDANMLEHLEMKKLK